MSLSKTVLIQEHKATKSKIILTQMDENEIRHLIKLAQNPSLVDLMGWDTYFEVNDINEFIEAISENALPFSQQSKPIIFGIFLDVETLPIGYGVLKGLNKDLLTMETGVAILDNKYRQGYGKLALARMMVYAFNELKIQSINATILASNTPSINMCKNLGFVIKKVMHNSWNMPNGDLVDMLWMELRRDNIKKQSIIGKQLK